MGRISTGVGLVSGINSKDIIDQLMALESKPKDILQTRIDSVNQQKLAYTDLITRLTGLKLNGTNLKKPSFFQNATTSSSDENVLTATAQAGAAVGSFQFQVARLVTSQQTISRGFTDFDSARVGAGTLTLEQGGGDLSQDNNLSDLQGGAGIRRGIFKITDRSGATAVIDTTAAVTLQDVVKKINTSLGVTVHASISGDHLQLDDLTGSTSSNLIVQDLADGHSAEDLGIAQNAAAAGITGTDINSIGLSTNLSQINDGRGIRTAPSGADFTVQLRDSSTFDVTLAGKKTVGEVIDAINTASGGKIKAEVVPGANGIRLTDQSGGGGAFSVTAINGSNAAADLGLAQNVSSDTIDGNPLIAGLGTVLISSLKGGAGLTLGSVDITDRAGGHAVVDLSGAKTVQDVLDLINHATGLSVEASLKDSGNGIQIADKSGGTGNLTIAEAGGGTTAADLGILGDIDTTKTTIKGTNLQRQWVSENSLLKDLNGGKGITPGKFKITDSTGKAATVDLTQGNEIRISDVMQEINSKGIGVTARINDNGDGLLVEDTGGGTQKLKIENVDGTTATDLRIAGEATGTNTFINGSYETTIDVTANDTLATLQTKINNAGAGLTANVINDGSSLAPFRLSLNSKNTGRAGRVVFDAGDTTLDTHNLVNAQDAAVFLGAADGAQPLMVTASSNSIAGVIKGVNIELHGVSDKPVTLNVTRSDDNVVGEVQKFADGFNDMVDKMNELTKFDTDTNTGGLLLGETTVQTVQSQMYNILNSVNPTGGRYRILADIGLTVGDGAKLTFDQDKFNEAYANDPDAVSALFSDADKGLGKVMEDGITRLIDPVNGVISRQNKTLDEKTTQFQDRMSQMDDLLTAKRDRLEKQFANLESVLANLQSQQQALGQIQSIKAPTASSSK
jgi:flagellar hook-associated protein 2